MKTIKVEIAGVSPLLMNKFSEEAESRLRDGNSSAIRSRQDEPRIEAAKVAYMDSEGSLVFPASSVFRAIIEAGKHIKTGRKQLTTQRDSLIPAYLSIVEYMLPFGTKHFEVDSRSVVNPATGMRNIRHRPLIPVGWKLSFSVVFNEEKFSAGLIRDLVDTAGMCCGLGDFRPNRKGTFGKFVVTRWEEQEGRTILSETI